MRQPRLVTGRTSCSGSLTGTIRPIGLMFYLLAYDFGGVSCQA